MNARNGYGWLSVDQWMKPRMHLATTLRREPEPKQASPATVYLHRKAAHTVLDEAFLSQQRELLGAAFNQSPAPDVGAELTSCGQRATGERHGARPCAQGEEFELTGQQVLVASCQRLESACLEDEPLASLGMRIDELERRYQATERLLKHAHR